MAARPYAKMITSVLESLTRRVDIFDDETGNLRHPLFAVRPEKRVLLVVISGDKGFAGAFNSNIIKTALQFINGNPGQGNRHRGGRPQGPRPDAPALSASPIYHEQTDEDGGKLQVRADRKRHGRNHRRPSRDAATSSKPSACLNWRRTSFPAMCHEEIDAAYIVYNEFKSVICAARGGGAAAAHHQDRRAADCRRRRADPGRARARRRSRHQRGRRARARRHARGRRGSEEIRHRRTWTTSTSSRPRNSSTGCCRSTFHRCCITP